MSKIKQFEQYLTLELRPNLDEGARLDAFFQAQMGLEASPPPSIQNRAKQSLADYLKTFPWDAFYTVTFRSPMRYAAGVLDKLRTTIPLLSVRGIGVAEQHITGMWHAHGLVYYRHQPGFTYTPDNSYAERRLARFGWSNISFVRSGNACAEYCSKYLVKDTPFEYEFYGKRKYWTNNA